MLPEFICPECFKEIAEYAEGVNNNAYDDDEDSCQICGTLLIEKYISIASIELSDDVVKSIQENILACGSEGCGKKWDSEDQKYIFDETNSNIAELFDETLNSLDKDDPYIKALQLINYEGYTDLISFPEMNCPECGGSVDGWYIEIKTEAIIRTLPCFPELPLEIANLPLGNSAHQIEYYRPDCSPYLIHLTHSNHVIAGYSNKDYTETTEHLQAPQILWLILSSQTIKKNSGIGLKHEVVCFSEKPLIGLKETLIGQESNCRKGNSISWAPYGVMFEKEYLRSLGVKPVLPVEARDEQNFPKELAWRAVPFSNSTNFLHEREWRCKDDLKFDLTQCIVLMPDFLQVEVFQKALLDHGIKVKGFLPILEIFACI